MLEFNMIKSDALYYDVARNGVVQFENSFKNLTVYGKFEALLFNSVIVLQEYCENHILYFEDFSKQLAKSHAMEAKKIGVLSYIDDIESFIEKRSMFYFNELQEYDNKEEYLSSKIFYCFFVKPLGKPNIPKDLSEVFPFHRALFDTVTWMNLEIRKIEAIKS